VKLLPIGIARVRGTAPLIALVIAAGVMLARFHQKIYVLIVGKKYNDQQGNKNVADDMDDPDRGF